MPSSTTSAGTALISLLEIHFPQPFSTLITATLVSLANTFQLTFKQSRGAVRRRAGVLQSLPSLFACKSCFNTI